MGRVNLLFIYALSNAQIRATSISIIATIYHFFTDKNINIYGELGYGSQLQFQHLEGRRIWMVVTSMPARAARGILSNNKAKQTAKHFMVRANKISLTICFERCDTLLFILFFSLYLSFIVYITGCANDSKSC